MSVLDDLLSYITSTAGSTGLAGLVFLGRRTDTPADQVAIAETGGMAGEYVFSSTTAVIERPRVQVTSRATTYSAAHDRIKLVEGILESMGTRLINSHLFHGAQAIQPAFLLEYDESNRPVLCQNFEIAKARTSA